MMDCLFIGSATKDILMQVESPPASDQRLAATNVTFACGGIASVAASAFQKLGGAAGLISAVGRPSDVTDFIRADLEARNLAFLQLVEFPLAESPFSAIQVERDGRRCITHFGGCIRQLTLEQLDKKALGSAKMIHLGGLDGAFCAELAAYCRTHTEAVISIDSGNLSREDTDRVLPWADILIPDDKTVAKTLGVSPEEACRYYADHGVKTACVTLGDKGSVALQNGVLCHAKPYPARVVDTTGAGDNFHGAFLYCAHQGWPLQKTLSFCNAFSSLTCEGLGGRAAEPTKEETLRKMEE